MSLFDVEQEVWDVEGVRIAFLPSKGLYGHYASYIRYYPKALPVNSTLADLEERVAMVVGEGVPFVLLTSMTEVVILNTGVTPVIH